MVHRSRARLAAVVAASVLAFGIEATGQRVGGPPSDPSASQPPRGTGLISGQVVDATSGKPVAGVTVSLGGGANATFSYTVGPGGQQVGGGPGRPAAPPGAPRLVLTDRNGRFVFHDIAPGNYVLRATMFNHAWGGYGQNRPNGPVQPFAVTNETKLGNMTIRIWKNGVISGTVLDEANEPVVAVQVAAVRRRMENGAARLVPVNYGSTDDRGAYRIAGLTPGDYLVAIISSQATIPVVTAEAFTRAMNTSLNTSDVYRQMTSSGAPWPSLTGARVGDLLLTSAMEGRYGAAGPAPGADGKISIYPTTFHPSALTVSQATAIKVDSGEERSGIDLHLRLVPSLRVSGTVIAPEGPLSNTGVKLYSADTAALTGVQTQPESASTITDGAGAFTFLGVTPGQYTLEVFRVPRPMPERQMAGGGTTIEVSSAAGGGTIGFMSTAPPGGPPLPPPLPPEPTLAASLPITVTDRDLTNVAVALRPGPRVSGRVQFAGTREPPTPAQIQRAFITFAPTEPRPFEQRPEVRVEADGRFVTGGLVPGRYQITASVQSTSPPAAGIIGATGWRFKSATADGRNISDDPLEVGDKDITNVVITFTDAPTQLTGTVLNPSNQPDKVAEVIVFPADSTSWKQGVPNPRRIRAARSSLTGIYEFSNLPAGEYFAVAVSGQTPVNMQDPAFLERLTGVATRVTLADGEKKTQELVVKAVRP